MPNVIITEFMDDDVACELTSEFGGVYDTSLVDERARLKTMLKHATALVVRNRTRVDEDLLSAAPALRVVGRLGVGLDNIDIDACRRRSVEVRSAVGTNHVSVAEYVLGALLLLSRPLFFATDQVAAGQWPRTSLAQGAEIAGKTLGLIGFGLIARTVAIRARAFGMHVRAFDPHLWDQDTVWAEHGVMPVDLGELLAASNAISVHTPLTPETRGLIGTEAIGRMRKGALLVNTARGGIIDEVAVVAALRNGDLGGAALDVFETEPLPATARFQGVPNLILSPHLAGLTDESAMRISRVVADAVRRCLR